MRFVSNTAILMESGLVLNSEKCQNFSLSVVDIGENFGREDYTPPTIELVANTGKREVISTFYH